MKQFSSFVIKEAKHIVRDRRTMLILFVMPVVLMLLFGFAISNDVRNVRTVVVTSQIDHLTQQVIDRLSHSEYFLITATVGTSKEAEQLIRKQKADMALVFSKDFAAKKKGMQFIVDASDPNMAQQWSTYAMQTILNPQTSLVETKMLYNPRMKSAYNFVPAIMGMLLMLICAMMTSVSIVREKEKGTMEVLLVSPVKPLYIIISKMVPYLLLSLINLAIILLLAYYMLDVPMAGGVGGIVLVSFIYLVLALALGMMVSNMVQSQIAALLISAMVMMMPVIIFSGMMFPIENLPWALRWISYVIPPRWYIDAMRKLMIEGVALRDVVLEVGILLAETVALMAAATKKFNDRLEQKGVNFKIL